MAIPEPEDGDAQDIEAMAKSRRWWHQRAVEAAHRGNFLAGSLMALENEFHDLLPIGWEYDPDEQDFEDMEAW